MRNWRCNNICVKLRLYKYSKERAKTLEIKTHKYLEIDDQINNPIIKEINSMRKIKRYNLFVENKTIEMRYCAKVMRE